MLLAAMAILALCGLFRLCRFIVCALCRMHAASRQREDDVAYQPRHNRVFTAFKRASGFAGLFLLGLVAFSLTFLDPPPPAAATSTISPQELRLRAIHDSEASARFSGNLSQDDERAWQAIRKPVQIFHLEGPETSGSEFAHHAATRGVGARQDVLIWTPGTEPGGKRARIVLMIERHEHMQPAPRSFFADLAQRMTQHQAALEQMSDPAEIATKFGPLQVAEARMVLGEKALWCTAFRRVDGVGLVIAGWYCPPAGRPVDRVAIGCFIDRLDLVGAGTDHALRRHFAESERNRSHCSGLRQAGRKLTWLDHDAPVPPLKLSRKKH